MEGESLQEMTGYTWHCDGCGKTGKRRFNTYEEAQFAGDNHWRGLAGNLIPHEKCHQAGQRVVRI